MSEREYNANELFEIWKERNKEYQREYNSLLRQIKKDTEYKIIDNNLKLLKESILLEKKRKRLFTKERVKQILEPMKIATNDIWIQFQEKQKAEIVERTMKVKKLEG